MKDFDIGLSMGFVFTLIGGTICIIWVTNMQHTHWQREAVKHGAAEYLIDPATGNSKWQWKIKAVESL